MKKFILLRGHEGSGKSTFALEKIAQFQHDYPQAFIVHIDNDQLLLDENGVYHFEFEAFTQAHRNNMAKQQATFDLALQEPNRDILLINANPNQKSSTCQLFLEQARACGFICEIYRLHNFFQNLHQVQEEDVLRSFLRLQNNPIDGEIHVPAVQGMNENMRKKFAQMQMPSENSFSDGIQ